MEKDCRAYWIEARWGGKPACARCNSTRVRLIRGGIRFECAACGHQTSLTSGTVPKKSRKPLKIWFRAIFEISTPRTGISGKNLQRIMGFGSYDGVDLAAQISLGDGALGQRAARPLRRNGRGAGRRQGRLHKQLVLAAAKRGGRVRLAHTENNDAESCRRFAEGEVAPDAAVTTDGHAGYSGKSLGQRSHEAMVQTKTEKREADAVQTCQWTISLLQR